MTDPATPPDTTHMSRHAAIASRRAWWWSAALMVVVLAACATPTTPPAETEALPVPPAPPARPAPRPALRATWTFQPNRDNCRATARAGQVTLVVSAGLAGPIRLVLSPLSPSPDRPSANRRMELRFSGPAGTWQIAGTTTPGNTAVFSFGADEVALSRLLIMLSGGTINPAAPGLPLIDLPPTSGDGTSWFNCVRGALS